MTSDFPQLTKALILVGLDLNGRNGLRGFLYLFFLLSIIFNEILFIIYEWDDIDHRITGLKATILYSISLVYFLAFFCKWDDSILTVKTVLEGQYKFPYEATTRRKEMLKMIKDEMVYLNNLWYYGLLSYTIMTILSPIIVYTYRVITHNVTVDSLFLPYPFYYPENQKILLLYLVAYILQSLFHTLGVQHGYATATAAFLSMKSVEGDLKLLRLSVEQMEEIINRIEKHNREAKDGNYVMCTGSISLTNDYYTAMKLYLNYLVKHHQHVYRKVIDVTKGISIPVVYLNSAISVFLCVIIYIIVKRDNTLSKVLDVMFFLLWFFNVFCFHGMAEKVVTEDKELRKQLYQSSWIDKPQWFKKSLLIMMARTNRTIEFKPGGVFQLNLKNFSMTVKAAYSYFNVINNVN